MRIVEAEILNRVKLAAFVGRVGGERGGAGITGMKAALGERETR